MYCNRLSNYLDKFYRQIRKFILFFGDIITHIVQFFYNFTLRDRKAGREIPVFFFLLFCGQNGADGGITVPAQKLFADEHAVFIGQKIAAAFFRNECHFVDRKKELVKQYVTGTEMEKDSLARLFENLITDYEQEESRIVRENPDSRAAACAVSAGVSMYTYKFKQFLYSLGTKVNSAVEEQKGWAALLERYAMLGDAQKAWLATTDFQKRLTAVKSKMELARLVLETSAGKEAPDMLLTEKGGKEIRLRQIPGKLRIVDFWASWCGPCRKSNPFMLALYEEFKDKGLEVVSVSVDVDEDAWLKAVKEDKLTWKYNVRDLKGQAGSLYGITAIPCVLLLDDNNQILGRNLPKDELRRIVEERLK